MTALLSEEALPTVGGCLGDRRPSQNTAFIVRDKAGRPMTSSEQPGYVDGRHYTEYVKTVKQLKRDGRLDEAVALLLRLVDATEAEDAVEDVKHLNAEG